MPLHRVKLVKIGAVTAEFKRAKNENLPRLGCNLTIIVHLNVLSYSLDIVDVIVSRRC